MTEQRHLKPTSLREQALAELRAQLVLGALKPGHVYSAAAIAVELGVSNGPVREAMLELVSQGLMETVRNRGYRVVSLSQRDRRNIAELRTLVEIPSMVKLAGSPALTARAAEFHALVDELLAAARAHDMNTYLELDREFHLGLLSLLDNDRVTDLIGTLRDQTRQYGIHALSERDELMSSADEHRDILEALLAGDPAVVESLMQTHLSHLQWSGWSSPDLEATAPGPSELD